MAGLSFLVYSWPTGSGLGASLDLTVDNASRKYPPQAFPVPLAHPSFVISSSPAIHPTIFSLKYSVLGVHIYLRFFFFSLPLLTDPLKICSSFVTVRSSFGHRLISHPSLTDILASFLYCLALLPFSHLLPAHIRFPFLSSIKLS